jgi:hypothetical protein
MLKIFINSKYAKHTPFPLIFSICPLTYFHGFKNKNKNKNKNNMLTLILINT